MKHLETSDWLVLNNIIYKIYTTKDLTDMRQMLLDQLKFIIDFDAADFFLARTDGKEGLTKPVTLNCDDMMSCDTMDEADYSRGIMYSGKSIVYRETDIIADYKRTETEYYQKVYQPNRWHYSLQMVLGREKQFLGVITFYRTIGKEDFTHDDIFLVDMLKDHLAFRLFESKKERELGVNKITVSEATREYRLTRREEGVLRELMTGKDNEEISDELSITVNTLKKHILNIYRKLGIRNRVQMMKMIRERDV